MKSPFGTYTRLKGFPFRNQGWITLLCAVSVALLLGGCWQTEPSNMGTAGPNMPVKLAVNIGKVEGMSAGLGKPAAISLQKLVLVFASSGQDTIRDTITNSSTPALNASATAAQGVSKVYSLPSLRSWKIVATVLDARDSVTHKDSASTAVIRTVDTLVVPLTLGPRYVMYTASFNIPDSITSVSGTGPRQVLRINRLVLKVDGVVVADSIRPGYFAANTISSISFDYVAPGTRTIQLLAYGPMNHWDESQPLYGGSTGISLVAGQDSALSFDLTWMGPNTGVKGITVTLNKAGSVSGSNAMPGTSGLPPAWTSYDLAGTGYHRVAFVSSNGVIVGDDGVILRTSNSGTSWTLTASNTTQHLYSVVSYSGGGITDWVAGDSGTILAYSSGTWVSRAGDAPNTVSLRGIDYKSSTAWAIGTNGTILNSTNIGVASPTWTPQASGTTATLNAIVAFGTTTALIVGDSGVSLRLASGTWSTVSTGTTRHLRGLSCQSSSNCWAVGDSGTILTYNGTTWSPVASPTTRNLRDVGQQSNTNVIAVGDSGTALKWNGSTWTTGTSNTTENLNGVVNFSASNAWAVGGGGTIRISTTGGSSYTSQPLTLADFYGVHFPGPARGFAVGSGGAVFRYSSSNNRWGFINSGTTNALNAVYFTDNNTGWAAGATGTIVRTVNGGNGWTTQTSGTANALNGIFFVNSTTGWAVGAAGTIRGTINGTTWNTITSGTTNPLNAIFMRSATLGWVVGDSSTTGQRGIIRKTTDGGANWTAQTSGTTAALRAVHFTDDTTGWAVGASGTILKTTNGGANWNAQVSGTGGDLQGVYFVNANTGFAVGLGGKILKTTNGGSRWTAQYLGTSPNLYGVGFGNSTLGWAVGTGGTLMSFNP